MVLLFRGSRDVIDINSVILSKCHSGESLFEYYLQEFQYGTNVFQTTTNKTILTKCWGSTTENMKLIIQEYAGWRRV